MTLNQDEAKAEGWTFVEVGGIFQATDELSGSLVNADTLKGVLRKVTALTEVEAEENEERIAEYWKEKKTRGDN